MQASELLIRNKRIFAFSAMILLILLSLTVSACGGSDDAAQVDEPEIEANEPPPVADRVEPTADTRTLVFYGSHFSTDEARNPEQALIKQFEETHPHININRQPMDFDTPLSIVQSYLRREPFNVVLSMWSGREVTEAMANGELLDLSQLLIDTGYANDYPASFLAMGDYEGKIYFLPVFYSWHALYYNPDVFAQHNLTPPETWLDFLAVAEALQQQGITPLVYGGNNSRLSTVWFDYLNSRLNGPEFHQALMRGEEFFDDRQVENVFQTWQALVDNNYVVEGSWGLSVTDAREMVISGEAGMILLHSSYGHPDLDFFQFPVMNPSLPVGEVAPTLGYLIPIGVPNQTETLEFLSFLGSAETQTALTAQFGSASDFLPVHQGVNRQDFTMSMDQGMALVQSADQLTSPYYLGFDDMRMISSVTRAFRNILLGEDYVEDMLKLEEQRQQLID